MIINVEQIPTSVETFLKLRNDLAKTPEGGAAILIVGLLKVLEDAILGKQFLLLALDRSNVVNSSNPIYKDFGIRPMLERRIDEQLGKNSGDMIRSLVLETNCNDDYDIAGKNLAFMITRNSYSGSEESGVVKVYIASSGAASSRPVTMVRNDKNIWKAKELSSILVGVKSKPVQDEL